MGSNRRGQVSDGSAQGEGAGIADRPSVPGRPVHQMEVEGMLQRSSSRRPEWNGLGGVAGWWGELLVGWLFATRIASTPPTRSCDVYKAWAEEKERPALETRQVSHHDLFIRLLHSITVSCIPSLIWQQVHSPLAQVPCPAHRSALAGCPSRTPPPPSRQHAEARRRKPPGSGQPPAEPAPPGRRHRRHSCPCAGERATPACTGSPP